MMYLCTQAVVNLCECLPILELDGESLNACCQQVIPHVPYFVVAQRALRCDPRVRYLYSRAGPY